MTDAVLYEKRGPIAWGDWERLAGEQGVSKRAMVEWKDRAEVAGLVYKTGTGRGAKWHYREAEG